MPWRRKPVSWLRYWQGPVNRDAGFKTVLVYCVGPEKGGPVCGHNAPLMLADLPDWDWRDQRPSALHSLRHRWLCGYAKQLERGNQLQ
jgi:hypothetical protein